MCIGVNVNMKGHIKLSKFSSKWKMERNVMYVRIQDKIKVSCQNNYISVILSKNRFKMLSNLTGCQMACMVYLATPGYAMRWKKLMWQKNTCVTKIRNDY